MYIRKNEGLDGGGGGSIVDSGGEIPFIMSICLCVVPPFFILAYKQLLFLSLHIFVSCTYSTSHMY